ncbi:MAG: SLC13 family permease [Planctomycetota bacterium]|nr:SLC13 family permease [Planctomycetota bacterium]MDA0934861.1 SLC13 family permease [Planctomycetota bacterium]
MPQKARALVAGPALAALTLAALLAVGLSREAAWTAAVTVLCAAWWVTEALPLAATGLVPFAAFPLLGILDHKQVAHAYGHYLILLFLGGFMMSKAIEKNGAHRRLALGMLGLVGRSGRRGVLLGFMVATAATSMWISNTATVLMMLPVAQALLLSDDREDLRVPLLLGIAYAGSIGGIGTPIGTPPNMTFMAVYETATGAAAVTFVEWMTWGVPVVVLMIPAAWLILGRRVSPGGRLSIPDPGPWQPAERRVLAVFALTAVAWVLRDLPIAGGGLKGWFGWTGVGDDTIALCGAIALFVLPSGREDGGRLLDWKTAEQIPWGILILFAGGLAIAEAFKVSGLSAVIGDGLATFAGLPPLLLVLGLCLGVTFLTEVTSNTATTALLMPILAAAAPATGLDARVLMVPAAMSASCAFMLPVATAPNAIVFGTGQVGMREMVWEGLLLNLAGALVIAGVCWVVLG